MALDYIETNAVDKDAYDFIQSVLEDRNVDIPAYKALPYQIAVKEKGSLIGAVTGYSAWDWFHIELFGITRDFQRQGIGANILKKIEDEAVKRGCVGVWLQTMSFSAPDFYKKFGYEVFGCLENSPEGHQRIFMKKSLGGTI